MTHSIRAAFLSAVRIFDNRAAHSEEPDFAYVKEQTLSNDEHAAYIMLDWACDPTNPEKAQAAQAFLAELTALSQHDSSNPITRTVGQTLQTQALRLFESRQRPSTCFSAPPSDHPIPTAVLQLALRRAHQLQSHHAMEAINSAMHAGLHATMSEWDVQSIANTPGSTLADHLLTQCARDPDINTRHRALLCLMHLYQRPGTSESVRSRILEGAYQQCRTPNKLHVLEGTPVELAYLAAQWAAKRSADSTPPPLVWAIHIANLLPRKYQTIAGTISGLTAATRPITAIEMKYVPELPLQCHVWGEANERLSATLRGLKPGEAKLVACLADSKWVPFLFHAKADNRLEYTAIDIQHGNQAVVPRGQQIKAWQGQWEALLGEVVEFDHVVIEITHADDLAHQDDIATCLVLQCAANPDHFLLAHVEPAEKGAPASRMRAAAEAWAALPAPDKAALAVTTRAAMLRALTTT